MKVILPFVKKDEFKDGKRIFETEDRSVDIDNTLVAQMRWEANFPEIAARESIVDYAMRLKGESGENVSVLISKLKVLFCFFKLDVDFVSFLKMFDFSQREYVEGLIEKISEAFNAIFEGAAEKN